MTGIAHLLGAVPALSKMAAGRAHVTEEGGEDAGITAQRMSCEAHEEGDNNDSRGSRRPCGDQRLAKRQR